jgi:hypothetical protein
VRRATSSTERAISSPIAWRTSASHTGSHAHTIARSLGRLAIRARMRPAREPWR